MSTTTNTTATTATAEMIKLWQVRQPVSPSQLLLNCSHYCDELNIKSMDVYGDGGPTITPESSWLRRFEMEVTETLGMNKGLFLPSGTMAQQIALCIHGQKQNQSPLNLNSDPSAKRDIYFICHHSSHLLLHEFNSYDTLLNMRALVIPRNTLSSSCGTEVAVAATGVVDIASDCDCDGGGVDVSNQRAQIQEPVTFRSFMDTIATLPINDHGSIAAMILECPHRELGGKCTPLEDIVKISAYCRSHGIKLHMDGARLWEAQAVYCSSSTGSSDTDTTTMPLKEFCQLFDSIYVSFYKGLGGITGAMLLCHSSLEEPQVESNVLPASTATSATSSLTSTMVAPAAPRVVGFIDQAREWQKRFGGGLFSCMPFAVSCWNAFRTNHAVEVFLLRRNRLREVVAAVSESLKEHMQGRIIEYDSQVQSRPLLRFDPPVPSVSLIHVYFGGTVEMVEQAHAAAVGSTGISVYNRVRTAVGFDCCCYTEFNMGDQNADISIDKWITGYTALINEIVHIKAKLTQQPSK